MNDIFANENLESDDVSGGIYIRQRLFAIIGFSFAATLFLASLISQTLIVVLAAIVAALLIPCFILPKIRKGKVIIMVLITALIACVLFAGRMHFSVNSVQGLNGVNARFTGQIVREIEHNDGLFVYTVRTSSIGYEGVPQRVMFELFTYDRIHAEVYDTISAEVEFSAPRPENLRRALANGTYISAYLQMWSEVEVVANENRPLTFLAIQARRNAVRVISEYLPQDEAAIVQGLTLSHTSNINNDVRDNFARAGVGHMLAVSGQHLAIIVQAAFALFMTRFKKRTAALLTIPVIIAFVALAGFPTGAIRSGIMATIFLVFLALGKQSSGLNSLGFAVLIVCLVNPFLMMDLSFLLSVMATLGILVLARPIYGFLSRFVPRGNNPPVAEAASPFGKGDKGEGEGERHDIGTEECADGHESPYLRLCGEAVGCGSPSLQIFVKFLRFIYKAFSVCVAASVFLIPIFVFQFGYMSIMAPLSNILIYFAVSAMLVLTVGLIALSFVPFSGFLIYPGFIIVGFLARFAITAADWLARVPFGVISLSADFVLFWFMFAVLVLGGAAIFKKRKFVKPAAVLLVVTSFVIGMISQGLIDRNVITISVLQVGSGKTIVVRSGGEVAIIGLGGTQGAQFALRNYMMRNNVRRIDVVLLPNLNEFFADNAVNVLRSVEVGEIFLPDERENAIGFALDSLGSLNVREFEEGERINLINGVYATNCDERGVLVLNAGGTTISVVHPGGSVVGDSDFVVMGALFAENVEEFRDVPIVVSVAADFAGSAIYRMEQIGARDWRLTSNGFVQIRVRR